MPAKKKSKSSSRLTLVSRTFSRDGYSAAKPEDMQQAMQEAVLEFKGNSAELGFTLYREPIATAQPHLFDKDKVDITVRALVETKARRKAS